MVTDQLRRDLEAARAELDPYASLPSQYTGELRRHVLAQSVHYSTRIEGNTLTIEQVESLLAGKKVAAPRGQLQEAQNHAEAIAYAQSLAVGPNERITEDNVRTIHYLLSKSLPGGYDPGRYRTVQNFVIDRLTDRRVFFPPRESEVPDLMGELLDWLNSEREMPPTYRAALAHLNLVAVHPFLDGNGRTARVLETLLMYQADYRSQALVSLEAYYGRDTRAYYDGLRASLGPRYGPDRADVTPWIDYSLRAHIEQANGAVESVRRVVAEVDGLWEAFEGEGVTPWQNLALWIACRWGRASNRDYRLIAARSSQPAAGDLSKHVELGLLQRIGMGRSTVYVATPRVRVVFDLAQPNTEDPDLPRS